MNQKNSVENIALKMGYDYLSGKSLRIIGETYGFSHVTVRDKILSLKNYDCSLYFSIIDLMEENRPASLNKKEVQIRVEKAIYLLVNKNLTVIQIAQVLESTEFIIYRDLVNRAKSINNYIENKISIEVINSIPTILKQHSMDNLNNTKQR